MNFFSILLDNVAGFVKRNPILCLAMVIAAVAFPPLFGALLWAVIALVFIAALSTLLLLWRLRKVQRTIDEQFRDAAGAGRSYESSQQGRREGDVSLHRTSEAPGKRVNDNVGEYVDFEEEKNND